MQNVQVLSQPTEIDTQALYADSRRLGRSEGKFCSDSTISTCASGCAAPARAAPAARPGCGCRRRRRPRAPCSRMRAAVLLGQAAADRDLHARPLLLGRGQVAQVAVEPVVGVLADRAGVEDDQVDAVARRRAGRPDVAGMFEQAGQPLGVVDVHLAPVGADVVGAAHVALQDTQDRSVRPRTSAGVQCAISVLRDSRTTVTRIWPGIGQLVLDLLGDLARDHLGAEVVDLARLHHHPDLAPGLHREHLLHARARRRRSPRSGPAA